MDIVKVLRIIEYVGPRDQIEKQIKNFIHGTKKVVDMTITVVILHEYPEILIQENREETDDEWLDKKLFKMKKKINFNRAGKRS